MYPAHSYPMGFLKGQSSSEYLSNYTIASAVILIVLAALTYMGLWNWLFPSQVPICIFQKGLDCDTHYIQYENDTARLVLFNQFEDAIVISAAVCSAENVNPATALPYGRNWNDPPTNRPKVNNQDLSVDNPIVKANERFELEIHCYAKNGNGIGTLSRQERYAGLVFIQYRLNSSPAMFTHMIHGNLQGNPQ